MLDSLQNMPKLQSEAIHTVTDETKITSAYIEPISQNSNSTIPIAWELKPKTIKKRMKERWSNLHEQNGLHLSYI